MLLKILIKNRYRSRLLPTSNGPNSNMSSLTMNLCDTTSVLVLYFFLFVKTILKIKIKLKPSLELFLLKHFEELALAHS